VEVTRKNLAGFIGAEADEVSFFQTTASALSQAALSIPLKEGDEILTWDQEYPSNFYPWRIAAERTKAKLIQVPSLDHATPVAKLLERVTNKTKVIAVSWVQFLTGSVTDLKALSDALKGRDIWLVADLIQGVGVRPFHFHESGFDIVCSGSHKWLCSGFGAAFMAVKKQRIEQLEPLEYGAMTYGMPETPKSFTNKMKTTGHRFEPGSKSMVEIIAMSETLKLFSSTGMENIFSEASRLADALRAGLRGLNLEILTPSEGPILNVTSGREDLNLKMAHALKENKISYALRGPGIRLSLHAFNLDVEVEKTLGALSGALK
jgi:selenocysteine lyase/cysteine desulfurase